MQQQQRPPPPPLFSIISEWSVWVFFFLVVESFCQVDCFKTLSRRCSSLRIAPAASGPRVVRADPAPVGKIFRKARNGKHPAVLPDF